MSLEDAMNMPIEERVAWFRRDLAANPLTTAVMIATADLRFLLDAIEEDRSPQQSASTSLTVDEQTQVIRELDKLFERVGGSTRHWVRLLNADGYQIARTTPGGADGG